MVVGSLAVRLLMVPLEHLEGLACQYLGERPLEYEDEHLMTRCLITFSNDDHPDAEFKSPKISWRGGELDELSSDAKFLFPNSPSQRWNPGTRIVARTRFGLFQAGSSIDSA